jgi:SAM-dependent methyltransferase
VRDDLRGLAKKSTVLTVGAAIVKNLAAHRPSGKHTGGLQSATQTPEEAVAYILRSFTGILKMGRMTSEDLRGRRILELGPGDTLGLALCMVAAGAEYVCAVDRFAPHYDSAHQTRIYQQLRAELPAQARGRFDAAISLGSDRATINPACVELRQGEGIETIELPEASFDLIMSIAVCEHLADPVRALTRMDRLLRPGGVMLHQIDLRDHGMFTAGGKHPLTWLTVPSPIWRLMTSNRGAPNRHLMPTYRDALGALGYAPDFQIDHAISRSYDELLHDCPRELVYGEHFGPDDVAYLRRIQRRLRPEFREMSDADLMTSGVFVTARKPAGHIAASQRAWRPLPPTGGYGG